MRGLACTGYYQDQNEAMTDAARFASESGQRTRVRTVNGPPFEIEQWFHHNVDPEEKSQ